MENHGLSARCRCAVVCCHHQIRFSLAFLGSGNHPIGVERSRLNRWSPHGTV
jgi:hypothetical protein